MNFMLQQIGASCLSEAKVTVELLPGADAITPSYRQAHQQHDNLCGPFWGAVLLKAFGDIDIDSAQLALSAKTLLPTGEPQCWVPPGAQSRQDYSTPLPTGLLAESGTSAQGLMQAIALASHHKFALIPLMTHWTADAVQNVLTLCQIQSHWQATPLCNVQTGRFWGSRLSLDAAIAYLNGESITPPTDDWSVGHFVTLAGVVKGSARSLVIVRDTYPVLGWDGYHLQPLEAIADCLNRSDGTQGGVFLFVASAMKAEVERAASTCGFEISAWDNGTSIALSESLLT